MREGGCLKFYFIQRIFGAFHANCSLQSCEDLSLLTFFDFGCLFIFLYSYTLVVFIYSLLFYLFFFQLALFIVDFNKD